MTATVTTVIPTYRRPQLLGRAIRSVLSQTYRDCAVAVFDNASGDDTAAVVAAIAAQNPRVTYHCHESNQGILANFIAAMSSVQSPLFSMLSDDDVMFPEFLETGVAALAQNPQAAYFAGWTLEFDDASVLRYVPMAYWPRDGLFQPHEAMPLMLGNRHPTLPSMLFRRDLMKTVGTFDPDTGPYADYDYEVRAAARFPIVVASKPCAAWVHHRASQSGGETAAIVPCYEKMISNIDDALAPAPTKDRHRIVRAFRGQLRFKLVEIAIKAQVRGQPDASREAAALLRDKYGSRLLGGALLAMGAACRKSAVLQRLLERLESARLRWRAAASVQRARAKVPDLDRYATYVRLPIT